MTITIIGSGKVGASAALNCGLRELDDLLLLDIIHGLPQGEAMDINHQLSEIGSDCIARGSNNYEDMRDSKFIVLVAGVGRKPGMTRMDLLKTNAGIIKDIAPKIANYANDATLIVVTNPLDPMTYLALKKTGIKKNKVMGMGGMLDLSRFKSFIQDATQVSTEIFEQTKKVAAEVIALKGATVYAPGNAVATMIESVVKNKRSVIPVSTLLEGEYGCDDVCIGVPAIVGTEGVKKIIELKLDSFEQDIFNKGVNSVKEAIKALQL
jgi:malate dehydrogenase